MKGESCQNTEGWVEGLGRIDHVVVLDHTPVVEVVPIDQVVGHNLHAVADILPPVVRHTSVAVDNLEVGGFVAVKRLPGRDIDCADWQLGCIGQKEDHSLPAGSLEVQRFVRRNDITWKECTYDREIERNLVRNNR